jgi:hypothetical protein
MTAVAWSGGKLVQMAKSSDRVAPARKNSPRFEIAQFLFLVGLAVAVFLLAQKAWCITAYFGAAGSTRMALSDHSRH